MSGIVSYYESSIRSFLNSKYNAIIGELTHAAGGVDGAQLGAWRVQIEFLQEALSALEEHPIQIYFEFFVPRMGRRADVVLLVEATVVVIEFKVNAGHFDASALNQVYDYALDLKNFHEGSHPVPILPIAISTAAGEQGPQTAVFAKDGVANPLRAGTAQDLTSLLSDRTNIPMTGLEERPSLRLRRYGRILDISRHRQLWRPRRRSISNIQWKKSLVRMQVPATFPIHQNLLIRS